MWVPACMRARVWVHVGVCACVQTWVCGLQSSLMEPLLGALSGRGSSRPAGRGALSPTGAAVATSFPTFCRFSVPTPTEPSSRRLPRSTREDGSQGAKGVLPALLGNEADAAPERLVLAEFCPPRGRGGVGSGRGCGEGPSWGFAHTEDGRARKERKRLEQASAPSGAPPPAATPSLSVGSRTGLRREPWARFGPAAGSACVIADSLRAFWEGRGKEVSHKTGRHRDAQRRPSACVHAAPARPAGADEAPGDACSAPGAP